MQARNGAHGYGWVTRLLHWTVALSIFVQFGVGLALDADDGGHGRGRGRSRGGASGHGRGRGRGGGDGYDLGDLLLQIHVVLGVTILLLAVLRLVWRTTTPLPPWATTLSVGERRVAHRTEQALYLSMVAMPLTGIATLVGGDDLLPAHIATHVLFVVAILGHLGLILKHQVLDRDRLLRRML